MRHMPDVAGVAFTPVFDQFVTEEQRVQAQIMKQQRMNMEEDHTAKAKAKSKGKNGQRGEAD